MKIKQLLLSALCATAVNLPIHAQDTFLIVDGTAHPAESGTTYQATTDNPPLTVQNNGGSYTGTNITLINNNPYSGNPVTASGAYIINQGQLSLTNSNITAPFGILLGAASGTLNNVTINAEVIGVQTTQSSLTLTGGKITLSMGSMGIALDNSNATVSGVNIYSETISTGVDAYYSALTLADSTITTGNIGVMIQAGVGTSTLNNVNITITRSDGESGSGYGVAVAASTLSLTGGNINTIGSAGIILASRATGTITNANITATGQDANALHLTVSSTATANLSNNTLTGGITADGNSQLTLTASNNTHLTGDITTTDHSTINLTLKDTQLNGTATHDTTSAINLKIETGTQLNHLTGNINTLTLQNGATLTADNNNGALLLNGAEITVTTDTLLTLNNGTILDYSGGKITLTGPLAIGENILIDLSALTETGDYLILDWSNATPTSEITDTQFNNATPGVEGTFTVANNQLTFTATTIPEPSIYILLGVGLGLLLITAHHRRRNAKP